MLVLFFTAGCGIFNLGGNKETGSTVDTASDSGADTDTATDSGGDTGDTGVTGDAANGATLYSSCAGCHGADGTGGIDIGGTPSADLTVKVPSKTDAELGDIIMNGYGTSCPPSYTDAQDVADVIAYLRVTFP